MDSVNFITFLIPYGVPSVIIGIVVAVINYLVDKLLKGKLSVKVKCYVPFISGIILYFLYDLVFIAKRPVFSEEVLSAGLICGSLGTVIFAFISNLKSGKISMDATELLIEELLSDLRFATEISSVADKIKNIVLSNLKDEEILSLTEKEIKQNSVQADDSDCKRLAELIFKSVKSLGKQIKP